MKTIETDVHISEDRTFRVTSPIFAELSPGDYHVVMVIDEIPIRSQSRTESASKVPLNLHVFKWDGWPADCTFRREDIYEDDGR
jgi:hypothetical protein